MMRKSATFVLTILLAFVLLLCAALPVFAMYEPIDYLDVDVPETLDAVQWFPCREGFEEDDLWEVQCKHNEDGTTYAQRFTETVEDTGNTNYLDTDRHTDGSLTITRNGADGETGIYAPYVRTLLFENVPYWNADSGNTLYFDFEATAGWSISLNFATEHTIVLDEVIAQACGTALANDIGAAGRYTGSLNLPETLRAIAQADHACSEAASAVLAMEQIPVPQLTIHCIGEVGSAVTIRKWLISTADDPQGENCYFACMTLMTEISYSISADCFPLSSQTADTATTTSPATQSPVTGNTELPIIVLVTVITAAIMLAYVLRKTATPSGTGHPSRASSGRGRGKHDNTNEQHQFS